MNQHIAYQRLRRPVSAISKYIDKMGEASFSQLLLAPMYVFVIVGLGFPLLYSLYLSFYDMQLTRMESSAFVGLGNYLEMLSDPLFKKAVPATAIFTVGSTALSVLIAMGFALLLSQPVRGRSLYRVVLLVPWAVPPVVNAWMWLWIFNYNFGVFNAIFKALGIISTYKNWLGHTNTAFMSLILAQTWKAVPFLALLLLAKLLDIPKSLYRAAKIDGATTWQQFRYITLPGLKHTLLVVIILQSMWNLKAFDLVFVLTKGQPRDTTTVLNYLVYQEAFRHLNLGYGAAIAWALSGIIVTLTLIYLFSLRERQSMSE